jgi:hypothetical protein
VRKLKENIMADNPTRSLQAGPEQVLYATVLEKGMFFGLILVIATYLVYVLGILKPYIPVGDIPKYWSMNVHDYLQAAKVHSGWAWLGMIGYGDFLNFIPIAVLAGITIFCFLAIVPVLWKQDDKVYAGFAVGEALILALAASGILSTGGH